MTFDPTQLLPTLETKMVKNLFFGRSINGTTGYEEAGGRVNCRYKCTHKLSWGEAFTLKGMRLYRCFN